MAVLFLVVKVHTYVHMLHGHMLTLTGTHTHTHYIMKSILGRTIMVYGVCVGGCAFSSIHVLVRQLSRCLSSAGSLT